MDTPTKDRPRVQVPGLPLYVMRGYECRPVSGDKIEFIGAHDGPLIQIQSPNETIIFRMDALPAFRQALAAVADVEAGDLETATVELSAMGFVPLPR